VRMSEGENVVLRLEA